MQTVEIRVSSEELPKQMMAMRLWLDHHHFEPSAFSCDEVQTEIVISVTFGGEDAAAAFAAQFSGHLRGRPESAAKGKPPSTSESIG